MSNLSIKIINEIGNVKTREEINEIWRALKVQQDWISRVATFSFQPGDPVKFTGNRGEKHKGEVIKVNRKYIKVKEGHTTWNVPASMLEKA